MTWHTLRKRRLTKVALGLLLASLAIGAVGIYAWGAAPRARAADPGTLRSSHVYGTGPFATYSGDSGGIGEVHQLSASIPAGHTYDVVVALSLNYRTSGSGTFVVGVDVRRNNPTGQKMQVEPVTRPVIASRTKASITLLFRISGVGGGTDYYFRPYVNVANRTSDASIKTGHLVLVADFTPR